MKIFRAGFLRAAIPGLAFALLSPGSFAADNSVWVNGITESINDVVLSASLPGIIGKRPVKEGDFVKAGQPVIELDRTLELLEEQRRKDVMELKKTDMDR